MSKKNYDVIIIGGGPSGIFTALELLKGNKGMDILLLEKGKNINERTCPIKIGVEKCVHCKPCSIVNGWGGAGAFSDGKLTLTAEFGGVLDEFMSKSELESFIDYVDKIYLSFGATEKVYGTDANEIKEIQKRAAAADLKLIPAVVKHLGTEKCFEILKKMQEYLHEHITIKYLKPAEKIIIENNRAIGVETKDGDEFFGEYIVAVPGREGSEWFRNECKRLNLSTKNNAIDIGVRVEVPSIVLKDITDSIYESKLIYYTKSFDDRVRTFCMNPNGEVVVENNDGIKTVNGHSYADKKTDNTNFALLVSKQFTEPFNSPIAYGKYIATLANMLGEGVIVQRLGDLLDGRRTTKERLKRSLLQPTLTDIIEMLQAMDKVAPGVYSKHTLLYGVEVKFYSSRVELTNKLETEILNLFAAGDGAGITRGLAQASVAGVVVAREIINRLN